MSVGERDWQEPLFLASFSEDGVLNLIILTLILILIRCAFLLPIGFGAPVRLDFQPGSPHDGQNGSDVQVDRLHRLLGVHQIPRQTWE